MRTQAPLTTPPDSLSGKVVLITGAAHGIGAGLARRAAAAGAHVVIADVDADQGKAVATDVDGVFVATDVTSYAENQRMVRAAVESYDRLDVVILNAGVTSGLTLGTAFDPQRYRRVMGINLDGVVFGFSAALPFLRAGGGGQVVVTSSMAGIAPVPLDPVYAANKHALVGLVRSLGVAYAAENILVNAVCPAFADTKILGSLRDGLLGAGVPLLTVEEVVDVFCEVLHSGAAGQCWYIQPGRPAEPFQFRNAPGPRTATGDKAPAADPAGQLRIEQEHRLTDD